MGMFGPKHRPMRHVRHGVIVHIAAAALNETWIFEARNRLTYGVLAHNSPNVVRSKKQPRRQAG